MTYTLYRMRSRRGELLYVGQSIRVPQRIKEHSKGKDWWEQVHRIDLQHLPTQMDLDDAERKAIITETPRHNKVYSVEAFKPRVIPKTHRLLTATAVKRAEAWEYLGTQPDTLTKITKAGLVQVAGDGTVNSNSVIKLWTGLASKSTMIGQIMGLLDGGPPSGRASTFCWRLGEQLLCTGEKELLNEMLARNDLPPYPWAFPTGRY